MAGRRVDVLLRDQQAVNIRIEGLSHLPAPNVGDGRQGEAVVDLIEVG